MTRRRLRVGLLFGGSSVEHEVSVVSARGVASALDPERFECVPLAVTGSGRWLPPAVSRTILEGETSRVEPDAGDDGASVVAVPGGTGLASSAPGRPAEPLAIDVLFPVLHGWGGEDGRLQGLLDLAGVPFVGAGVVGSAVGMDKEISKRVFEARGLPLVPWRGFVAAEYRSEPERVRGRLVEDLKLPMFVKPANGGSSVGVSKVTDAGNLGAAIDEALGCDRKVIVEAAIDAREIECAVLGNDKPEASVVGEIVPSREFYDYAAKYEDDASQLLIPAPIDANTSDSIRSMAVEAFRALDLAGLARVDFLVDRQGGGVYVNEVNTLPGFTPISMYPKLWEASGVPYPELLARLVALAREREGFSRERRSRLRSG